MGDLVLLTLAVGLTVLLTTSRLGIAAGTALVAWVVLPGPLVVPNPLTSGLTFHRLVLVALAVAWWRTHGRRGPARPLADLAGGPAGPAVLALLLLAATVLALGAGGPASGDPGTWLLEVVTWLDRAATLAVVLLVGLALTEGRAWVRAIVVASLAVAVIAGVELATGRAWGEVLFRSLGSLQGLDAAGPLEVRGGVVRVRAGAEFALELGWVTVALLPALLAVLVDDRDRRWRAAALVGVLAAPAVVVATQSRSAAIALPIAVLAWALLARPEPDRRWIAAVGALLVVGVVGVVAASELGAAVGDVDPGSVAVRQQRLEVLTTAAADEPLVGLGAGAVDRLGVGTTDSSYLQVYAEQGVLGLGLLVLAVVAGLAAVAPVLLERGRHRPVAVAGLVGAGVLVAGSTAYDALTVRGSARLLWVLVGLGVAAAVRCGVATGLRPPRPVRAVVAGVVVAVGVVTPWLVSPVSSTELRFATVPVELEVGEGDPVVPYGRAFTTTVCTVVDEVADQLALGSRCRDEGAAAGVGRLRLAAGDADRVTTGVDRITEALRTSRAVPVFDTTVVSALGSARPVWASTAPVSGVLLGVGILLLPASRRAGSRQQQPERAPA